MPWTTSLPRPAGWYWMDEGGRQEPQAVFVGVGDGGAAVFWRMDHKGSRPVPDVPPGTLWHELDPPPLD